MTDSAPMPYPLAAADYYEAGWLGTLPVPYKEKHPVPTGWTGDGAPYPDEAQVARWCGKRNGKLRGGFKGRPEMAKAGNLSYTPGNIALRMPPNVVGIDVDLYDGKAGAETLADAVARWGELPPTWMSTSRRDGSGIRYFQVPTGLKWRDVGPGVETIKWYHRYAIVMPSVHDKTGKSYLWVTPDGQRVTDEFPSVDELPMLPAKWVAGLTNGQEYSGSGDAGDIDYDSAKEWLEEYGAGDMCSAMQVTLTKYSRSIREAGDTGGAHPEAIAGSWALIGDAGEGHSGALEAIGELRAVFLTAVADRRDGGGEWRRAVIKGVGKVREELKLKRRTPGDDPCDDFDDTKPAASTGSGDFDFECNAIANAKRLARYVGTDAHWVKAHNSWAVYSPTTSLWRLDEGNSVMGRNAMDMVSKMKAEAAYLEDPKAFLSWVKTSSGRDARLAMINDLKDFKGITVDAAKFDADPRALHVENGVIVLGREGASFRGRRHEDLATFATSVSYEAGARSELWDKFLSEVIPDSDSRVWAQTLFGYSLLGGNPERALVFAKGQTTSGKSTTIEAIAATLGGYAKTFNSQMFREKKDEGPRADLIDAGPKRLIYTIESSGEVQLHSDLLKRMTGNDRTSARALNSNVYVERKPAFTPWIVTNAYPAIPGSDKALQRRIFALPFLATILEVDPLLSEKLAEPAVQAAILAWLVEGWDLYCQDGLTKPSAEAMAARLEAISSLSLFDEFLAECCEEGSEHEGYVAKAEDVRNKWMDWLLTNGHDDTRMHTSQWVGRKMSDHGFERVRRRDSSGASDNKVWYRLGLRLK